MSDDLNNRGPADRSRVNLNEDYEARYWANKWGVSQDELRAAVERVGVMADDVERALKH
ncbi:DUF3606 domain-containing protein [Frateuria terrea]|uniref:DUF3606 domain-containing protein n=1 Tax=Frateuria terrea TaxID=529704 RepID=A0A1H6XY71_9GAMM|nr:DUF3606 domain-containing protein [Frateuria terrea]SEJ33126.1 Protein of unknown function [Frateuria terrea]SFP51024.1 Protein of unknown function [Frateuria terrea]